MRPLPWFASFAGHVRASFGRCLGCRCLRERGLCLCASRPWAHISNEFQLMSYFVCIVSSIGVSATSFRASWVLNAHASHAQGLLDLSCAYSKEEPLETLWVLRPEVSYCKSVITLAEAFRVISIKCWPSMSLLSGLKWTCYS